MMQFDNAITRVFHDEHLQTIGLLDELDAALAKAGKRPPPAPLDEPMARLLNSVIAFVDSELQSHFQFEEESLFPLLAESGDEGIAELLTEEHESIRPVGREVAEMARQARVEGFQEADWQRFRQGSLELIERLTAHIQKEEMGLLPMLDSLIDADEDTTLNETYLTLR